MTFPISARAAATRSIVASTSLGAKAAGGVSARVIVILSLLPPVPLWDSRPYIQRRPQRRHLKSFDVKLFLERAAERNGARKNSGRSLARVRRGRRGRSARAGAGASLEPARLRRHRYAHRCRRNMVLLRLPNRPALARAAFFVRSSE